MPPAENAPKTSVGYSLVIQNGAKGEGVAAAYVLLEVWDARGTKYEYTSWSVDGDDTNTLMGKLLNTINNPWPTRTFSVTYRDVGDRHEITDVSSTKSPNDGKSEPPEDPGLSAVRKAWAGLDPRIREEIVSIVTEP
jgi:hypothetical protein